MTVELHWETKALLCIKYSGTVSGDEILMSQNSMTDDERFDGIRGLLLDCFSITKNLSTENDIVKISAIAKAQSMTNPFIKNAVVLNPSEDVQALAAYYKLLTKSTGWKIELFETENDARDWLGDC